MASLAVGTSCGPGCGLLLVAVRDDSTQQCSDDGYGGRDDPRHNNQPIIWWGSPIGRESATQIHVVDVEDGAAGS
ncbi:hypothetical protein [Streptomyces sp. NPDC048623]|uniref:hypothetical protein n=1 Tax=Streptomyces sp. NPDC048623 TaxID=3155761 RepID=UPI00342D19C0